MDAHFSAESMPQRGRKPADRRLRSSARPPTGSIRQTRPVFWAASRLEEPLIARAAMSPQRRRFASPIITAWPGHLAFGFKAEAIRYLRRGLMIDPASEPIRNELARLGVRRRPVLQFLRRRHLLNRWFGRLLRRHLDGEESGALEAFRA
jgi:hypothetical protein